MTDPRVAKMARVLVEYSLAVQAGDLVRIQGAPEGAPLLLALYEAILARGGHPWTQISLDGTDEIFYTKADDAQLDFLPKFVAGMIEEIQASVSVWTETNTKRLTNADPAKQARRAAAMRPLSERFLERAAKKQLRWTGTVYPTHAFAQDAEMSLREFADFVFAACLVGEDDPIAAWKEISRRQGALIAWLCPRGEIHVVGQDTDLRLKVGGRTWINCDGHENFPDGEIFTGPLEESVNGQIRFSYPACPYGREVEDVRLQFKEGKVVEAKAAKNEQFLLKMLETDQGPAISGSSPSGPIPGFNGLRKTPCSTRRSGGRSTSPWGRAILRPGAGIAPRSTGTWSATSARAGRSGSMGPSSSRTGRSWSRWRPD